MTYNHYKWGFPGVISPWFQCPRLVLNPQGGARGESTAVSWWRHQKSSEVSPVEVGGENPVIYRVLCIFEGNITTWMSCWKLGSKVRWLGLYWGVYWVITHLPTFYYLPGTSKKVVYPLHLRWMLGISEPLTVAFCNQHDPDISPDQTILELL